jgi:hypothetical protein
VSGTFDRIVVPLSRVKTSLALLGSAAFVVIALLIWRAVDLLPDGNPAGLLTYALLVITILFFGFCGLHAAFKLFDRSPGLVIDDQGIIDNSSGLAAGRILWSEIKGIQVTRVHGQRFLTIDVQAPEKYVDRFSYLRRKFVRLNATYFGGPIHIPATTLKLGFDELVDIVRENFEKHRPA